MMEVATAPSTPENSNPHHAFRRSFTAPPKVRSLAKTSRETGTEHAETLFAHNVSKVVSFNTPTESTRRHSSVSQRLSDLLDSPSGTLPWASVTERTIAAGKYQSGANLIINTDFVWVHRAIMHLQGPRVCGFPKFRHSAATNISEVSMLVCGRGI